MLSSVLVLVLHSLHSFNENIAVDCLRSAGKNAMSILRGVGPSLHRQENALGKLAGGGERLCVGITGSFLCTWLMAA